MLLTLSGQFIRTLSDGRHVFAALNIVVLQGLDGGIQFQLSFTMLSFVGCQFNSGPLIYQLIACYIIPHLKNYRKIPKISLEAYIFERPFLRGLFLEGLIFGGAYIRREICVSKPIGLAI